MFTQENSFEDKKASLRKKLLGGGSTVAILLMAANNVMAQQSADAGASEKAHDTMELEEVIVTGRRAAMLSSILAKRDADSIMDAITADDIGKFPDTNLAESLQRITGVQIARDGSEGNFVSIRGMAPSFTKVTINGQAGTPADARGGFNFSLLGSEMAARLEVIKSVTAFHEEGGLGGTVNIKTRRGLDFKRMKLAVGTKAGYESLSGAWDPAVNALYANQFADGKIGIVLGGKYSTRKYRTDEIEIRGWHLLDLDDDGIENDYFLGRTRMRSKLQDKESYDLNGSLQYRPNDNLELYADVAYGRADRVTTMHTNEYDFSDAARRNRIDLNSVVLVPNDDGSGLNTAVAATTLSRRGDLELRDDWDRWIRTTLTTVVGGEWTNDLWHVAGAVSLARGTTEKRQQITRIKLDDGSNRHFIGYNVDPEFEGNIGAPVPMSLFAFNQDGSVLDVTNPESWSARLLDGDTDCGRGRVRCNFASGSSREVSTSNWSGNLDFNRILETGDLTEFSFGMRFRRRTRQADNISNSEPDGFAGVFPDILDNPQEFGEGFGSPILGGFPGFVTPAFHDGAAAREQIDAAGGVDTTTAVNADQQLFSREKTYAAYAMLNAEGDIGSKPYRANIGVRLIRTENLSRGLAFQEENDQDSIDSFPVIEDNGSYTDFLPSANIVFSVKDNLLLRLSASKVMTRPELEDVTSFVDVRFNDNDNSGDISLDENVNIKLGNGDLQPFRAWQFDAALEYYTEGGGLINVGLFYKDVSSFITDGIVTDCFDPTGGLLPGGAPGIVDGVCYLGGDAANGDVEFSQIVNGEGATIKGFEVGVQQILTFLPDPFDGFGVQANYTYVDSTSPLLDGATGLPLPLEGVSKHSYNLVAFYEKGRFSTRFAYNYRSEYLVDAVDALSNTSRMRKGRGQLDASASYDFNKNFSFNVSAINLTDTDTQDFVSHISRLRNFKVNGRRFFIGFNWKN